MMTVTYRSQVSSWKIFRNGVNCIGRAVKLCFVGRCAAYGLLFLFVSDCLQLLYSHLLSVLHELLGSCMNVKHSSNVVCHHDLLPFIASASIFILDRLLYKHRGAVSRWLLCSPIWELNRFALHVLDNVNDCVGFTCHSPQFALSSSKLLRYVMGSLFKICDHTHILSWFWRASAVH